LIVLFSNRSVPAIPHLVSKNTHTLSIIYKQQLFIHKELTMPAKIHLLILLPLSSFILVACTSRSETITRQSPPGSNPGSDPVDDELEIVTLLPKDGIPSIDNPVFLSAEEADLEYDPDELIIGVQFNGEARAYSIPLLSGHEIVNDTVGGVKIAVTW
jgi:hypothetical protein